MIDVFAFSPRMLLMLIEEGWSLNSGSPYHTPITLSVPLSNFTVKKIASLSYAIA